MQIEAKREREKPIDVQNYSSLRLKAVRHTHFKWSRYTSKSCRIWFDWIVKIELIKYAWEIISLSRGIHLCTHFRRNKKLSNFHPPQRFQVTAVHSSPPNEISPIVITSTIKQQRLKTELELQCQSSECESFFYGLFPPQSKYVHTTRRRRRNNK